MKALKFGFFVLLAVMVVIAVNQNVYAKGAKTLKIGAVFALTGPAAPGIKDNMQGVQVAADLINEKGGIIIEGHQYLLEIVPEDNKSVPDGTIAAANKLVYKDGVKFIVGPVVPLLSIAMTPITEKAKVLRCKVNGTGTQAEMNPDLHYTFSTFIEVQYIKSGYDYFVESYPGIKKIAITGPDEPGGQIFLKLSKKEAERRGLEVVYAEPYPFGTQDFYPILTKALAQKPDAIELGVGVAPWYTGLIKQARELQFNGPMFAPSTTGDIYFIQKMVGKDFAHDIFFLDPDLKSPEMPSVIKEIGKRVRDKYGVELTSSHCLGWEVLRCLVQAIEAAQSLDPTVVAQTWENMKNIQTLYGKGKMGGLKDFGINHVVMKPRPLARLKKGEVEFVKFITP
ncbi:MAG: ABC transporter substrate-binding protein [Deltaproteobacteria bacterium]|nr:ABC transporter substrate-binding protein [Deltaproteobacteria bacterium]